MKPLIPLRLPAALILLSLLAGLIGGCNNAAAQPTAPSRLKVTATISIVADIVKQVGGDFVEVSTIVPIGTDEHQYQPTPRDVAKVADAAIVFENGLGLEIFMDQLIQNAGGSARVVTISDGITPQQFSGDIHLPEVTAPDQGSDPHVWVDPNNVMIWVKNIEAALTAADPSHATEFARNAQAVLDSLASLDEWIKTQVAAIPVDSRKIVTDHMVFGYFCARYGFDQVGAIVPSYSTTAEASAQDLAALEDAIQTLDVKAIFLGQNLNSNLAQRVADDTGVRLIQIYTGSLTTVDGPAPTYQDYMRYNVTAIVTGLQDNRGTE